MTRVFPASRERVFEFLANPALLAKWWGPRGFSIPNIDFTPCVGATYRISMQPPEGESFQLSGIFREVDAPSQLAFTFEWEPADPDDEKTLAELSVHVIDDSTEVRLRQGLFKTEARRTLHGDGWTESFDRLSELLAEQR